MKCKYCGTKIPVREEFCPSCGKYAKSVYFGFSQTQYKTVYAIYCFGVSLLLLGFLYINHIRLFTGALVFRGLDPVLRCNLVEFVIVSTIAVIACLIIMILKRLRLNLWKCIYGFFSVAITFIIEIFIIAFHNHISTSDFNTLQLQSTLCSLVLSVLLVGLILYGFVLKWNSDVNILFDENCEVVSAIFLSNIAVMIATILTYISLI